jgi:hypothetical protein
VNTFVVEKWYDEGGYCSFYTVRWLENRFSETDRFFSKHEKTGNPYNREAYELFHLITHSIGDIYGAIDDFFDRTKNKAQALPPKPKRRIPEIFQLGINFPLRLYCFRISESIVVLFNGGIKDQSTDQESNDLSLKFYEAQQFADRISDAIKDGTMIVEKDKRTLVDFQRNPQIIL